MKLVRFAPPPLVPGTATQLIVSALVALGPFSLTMYQPALPAIAAGLNATTGQVQLTLTVYLAAFSVGQLILGPLSDDFGRRRILLIGLALFVIGSLACMLADSVETLIAARFLQGLGACAGPALGRAMIRDLYGAAGSAKAMAFVASALSIAPALAPVFGGYVTSLAGWPAIFGALAAVGLGMFGFVLVRVPETNPYLSERAFGLRRLAESYCLLLRDRRYLGFLFIAAAASAGFLAFQTAAPFLVIGQLGVAPSSYGWLLICLPLAYLVGTLIAGRMAGRSSVARTILAGSSLLIIGSGFQLACALAAFVSVTTLMASQMLWAMGFGIALPSAMAGAVGPFPTIAGAAIALQGFAMMAAGAVSSLLLARIGVDAVSLGAVMFAIAAGGTLIFCLTEMA